MNVQTLLQILVCFYVLQLTVTDDHTNFNERHHMDSNYQSAQQMRQLPYNCHPCSSCANTEQHCQAGVPTIMDGCNCCYMCARQQGDLCNDRHRCDDSRNLYCDKHTAGGVCRAKPAKGCVVAGSRYKDGDQFGLNCSHGCCSQQCSCQNGIVTCTSLCPHEDLPPSRLHCLHAVLAVVQGPDSRGTCCRQWVCPHAQLEGHMPVHPSSRPVVLRSGSSKGHHQVEPVLRHDGLGHSHGHHHKQSNDRL